MFVRHLLPVAAAVLFAGPAVAQSQQASVQPVGIAAGVRGTIALTPRGAAAGYAVRTGQPIHVGERVRSGPDGSMQIILLDETVFTIGPNSDIVIDNFGFDPRSGNGRVDATIGAGAFKFVTGKVAQNKPENMNVRVPTAIMGVRGTIVYGVADARQAIIALGGPGSQREGNDRIGAVNVRTLGGQADVRRSGYAAFVNGTQAPEIRLLDAATQQRILGALGAVQQAALQAQQQQAANNSNGGGRQGSGGRRSGNGNGGGGDGGIGDAAADAASAGAEGAARALVQLQDQRNKANTNAVPAFTANAATRFQEINGLTGTATFAANGNALTNFAGTGGTGTYDFSLSVNLGNRTLSGQFSNINIASVGAGNPVTNGTLTIPVTSYAGFTSGQLLNFSGASAFTGACGGANTCTGNVQLFNGASQAANSVNYRLTVDNAGDTSRSATLNTVRQ
jgi:hypothetical protein